MGRQLLPKILFTRNLSDSQLALASELSLNLSVHPFITTEYREKLSFPADSAQRTWVFTSPNAAYAIQNKFEAPPKSCFAVGEKTALALREIGIEARFPKQAQATALVELLKTTNANRFLYLAGALRRPVLEQYFQQESKDFITMEVYDTCLTQPQLTPLEYEWIAFCSPSSVISFFKSYTLAPSQKILAIGNTTKEAIYYEYQNCPIYTPTISTIEAMLYFLHKKQTT